MQNIGQWKPSKYEYKSGRLRGSRNPAQVRPSSRLICDQIAKFYDRELRLHARGRLLDLGCGKVPLYASYKDLVSGVTCVDWQHSLHKNPYLDQEADLNQPLEFPDASFDTVILSDVLEHIRRPEALMREISRILAPGGKLMMNVPFMYHLHEQPYDYFRYTEFALKSFAEESGLTVLMLEPYGGAPVVWADFMAKNFIKFPVVGKPLALWVQFVARIFIKTGPGKKYSAKTSRQFPAGYVMIAGK